MQEPDGENYVIRSYIIRIFHQTLLERSNEGGLNENDMKRKWVKKVYTILV
jgi:hypothetical protein